MGTLDSKLYLTEPGDSTPINPLDIAQGQIGDCGYLAALGEVAIMDPSAIAHDIHALGNGSERVTLYVPSGEGTKQSPFVYTPEAFNVTNQFPSNAVNNYDPDDILNNVKEIWPQVMEKAFAEACGGYSAISNGVSTSLALDVITGHTAIYTPIQNVTLAKLNNYANVQDPALVFDTPNTGKLGYNLINDHAYMFDGFTHQNGHLMVDLLNPWGPTWPEPAAVPFSALSQNFTGISHGKA